MYQEQFNILAPRTLTHDGRPMQPAVEQVTQEWYFQTPPPNVQEHVILLLTIMGVGIAGYWSGELGEHYSAWAQPLSVNKLHIANIEQAN